jgi:UDP-N-acetylglucosamine 2-epimerase (non-hydrolysing)
MKVMTIFGTRPEAVKMAPVIQELQRYPDITTTICVTAQHREMLDQVLEIFNISPHIDLDLMRANQTLPKLTASILTALDPVIADIQPDWIIAQGDTTTVMCASLLAYYHRLRFGHVEAGLRTHNKWEPFPEEINRRIAGITADLHFAPTQHSRQNLLAEGIEDWRIAVTGNPVIDALQQIKQQPPPEEARQILAKAGYQRNRKIILLTAHRRENFGTPMQQIFEAVRQLAQENTESASIIYPVHLNPNVRDLAHSMLAGQPNILLLDPLPYLTLVHVMKTASLVLTDSGGIQEEATALQIPTLVLREVTERPEGVQAGILTLVGSDETAILSESRKHLADNVHQNKMTSNPFGDGRAAEKIVTALLNFQEPEKPV